VSTDAKPAIDPHAAVYFGRRLEPKGRAVLHGVGQDHRTFVKYSAVMAAQKPVVYMAYLSPSEQGLQRLTELKRDLDELGDQFVAVQMGCGLASTDVLAGKLDGYIEKYSQGLKALGRPVYLRLGFEFNGHWNKYNPETFVPAWRRFMDRVRPANPANVATVWCYVPDGNDHDWMKWYPGDDYVDWWSFDPFSVQDITDGDTRRFIEQAYARRFPVMIGESTPRWVGVNQGELCWRVWFQRYFSCFDEYPNMKGFCYIAWNWAEQIKFDPSPYSWHWWGDGRVWENDFVFQHWREELAKPQYIHAGDPKAFCELIGFRP
jgi:hypothetical protein